MSKFKRIKEFLLDSVAILIACVTSFWFWLPVLFAAYMYLQLWLFFAVHPITIIMLPVLIAVYITWERERRLKAKYGLIKARKTEVEKPSSENEK